MLKMLITGSNGQLGKSLHKLYLSNYHDIARVCEFVFTDIEELDITNSKNTELFIKEINPDILINCAAYTNVDQAEDEKKLAKSINADAVKNLMEACNLVHAKLIHVSTDYVFNGKANLPYKETDNTEPDSAYGRTKLEGEKHLYNQDNAIIIRTSWLYSEFGKNFVKTILHHARNKESLNVVFDQVGTPTFATDLAKAIIQLVMKGISGNFQPGIYHYSNEGVCSWYDFARKIVELMRIDCKVNSIESKNFPTKAKRPFYSVLNKNKIKEVYNISIPHWETGLKEMLKSL